MVFFLLILLVIMLNGAKLCLPDGFNTNYLHKKNTTAVNGIFVLLVLFSHYAQYADFGGIYDVPYLVLREHLNQMVVATFMFYSGYGMMEAINNRGMVYVRKILQKFWQLLLRFDIAVLLYLAVNALLGIRFSLNEVLLAFTTWTAIGNSNWYITAVLILYIILYISFGICLRTGCDTKRRLAGIVILFILTGVTVYLQIKAGRPGYCYNTMLILPLGCLYSETRHVVEKVVMRSDISYLLTLTATTGAYIVLFFHRWTWGLVGYTLWAFAFISLVVLITMKLSVYNGFLEWIGKHIFGIYILQRLPMTVLNKLGYIENHKYMSLIVAVVVTFALAAIFQQYTNRLVLSLTCIDTKRERKEK